MTNWRGRIWLAFLAVLAAPTALPARQEVNRGWTASWAAAQQVPEPHNALAPDALADATLRQIVHLSAGGPALRVRLSNLFGTQPLRIDAARVALAIRPAAPGIDPATDRPLRFAGRAEVAIAPGAELWSDPVTLPTAGGADLAVSIHFAEAPAGQTSHPGSRATSYIVHGDQTRAATLAGATTVEHWFQLSGVAVRSSGGTLVAIGDSITDGHGAGTDANQRWPDVLAARFRTVPALADWGVVNAGIGGNRVLADGLGPKLVDRFDRDVFGQPGVRAAILLEGVNDLGSMTREQAQPPEVHQAMVARIEAAFRAMAARARRHGVMLIGGTITPFVGSDYYHPGPETEADRQAINSFIRTSGVFDAVVDFDAVVRDPAHPDRLLPAYDSGDHLHPSPLGYRAMADAVPLAPFTPTPKADAPAIALTFDDIPAHGPLPPGVTRLDVADAIIAALKAAKAPAFGFVNGGFGADNPQSPTVLAHWRAAGFPVGNHTFNHLNLNDNSADAFIAQAAKNEAVIAPLMQGADWHWFRFPFLAEGDTPAKRDAFRAWLAGRHYRIAAVTESFGDFGWNNVYAGCVAKGDPDVVAALEQSFIDAAREEALRQRDLSRTLYGRDVPLVLLMHLGATDARMLPRLLDLYRALGFRFVSLPDAERDPFYRSAIDPGVPGPSPTLEAVAKARGIALPPRKTGLPPADLCR